MTPSSPQDEPVTPGALKRLFLLSALPFLGFAMVVTGAILGFTDFSHNNSLNCGEFGSFGVPPGCSHHSYALAVALAIVGVVVMIGSSLFASYYAARRVGLPLLGAALQRRRPPQPRVNPPGE